MSDANITVQDARHALEDVRRAYRLVAAYQQRVIYFLEEVERAFPELKFFWWMPERFKVPPRGGTHPNDRWTWDGLPYFSTSNYFMFPGTSSGGKMPSNQFFLIVDICADTGFDLGKETASFHGPDPATFPLVSDTSSVADFYFYDVGQVSGISADKDIIRADDGEYEEGIWKSLRDNVRSMKFSQKLPELFATDGTSSFLAHMRKTLKSEGIQIVAES